MKLPMFFSISISSVMLLSACATTTPPKTTSQASVSKAAPKDVSANPNAQMARVLVARDFMAPIALKATIKVNGDKVGRLKNAQYLETYVEPGDHVLSVSFNKLSMARGTKYNISVAAGETYAWELESSLGMAMAGIQNIRLTQFDPKENPFKISDLTKIETKK